MPHARPDRRADADAEPTPLEAVWVIFRDLREQQTRVFSPAGPELVGLGRATGEFTLDEARAAGLSDADIAAGTAQLGKRGSLREQT